MSLSLEELRALMTRDEDEHLEYKEAKNRFDFELLTKYCAALANEEGGRIILGVTDRPPRRIVGTQAFSNLARTAAGIINRIGLKIVVQELIAPEGRVLVIEVPPRPPGMPIRCNGVYWMRGGDELVPMTEDMLKRIFAEAGPDHSASICSRADLNDLDPAAIEVLRQRWSLKSRNAHLAQLSPEQLLADVDLTIEGQVTIAALVLLGTERGLRDHLPQAEIVFEFRSEDGSVAYQQREEFRRGFLAIHDDLWRVINLRNDVQELQDGLFRVQIPTFNETVVREAVLNAVSHRDYRLCGSVFIRQFPRRLEIISPGGFPEGITPENILRRQSPRNRRIAEAFAKCGLVERSGQGADLIFREMLREGKPRPDFSGSDEHQVSLSLQGQIRDPQFLRFLQRVTDEGRHTVSLQDLLVLDHINRGEPVPDDLRSRLTPLLDAGIIERAGRGHQVLSRRFYTFLGRRGTYTRLRGLDRDTNKQLLLKHIRDHKLVGSPFRDLHQVLPHLSRAQVQTLLRELRKEGLIFVLGETRAALWFPEAPPPGSRPVSNGAPRKMQSRDEAET